MEQYGPTGGDFVTKFAYEEYAMPTVLGRSIMVSSLGDGKDAAIVSLILNRLFLERLQWYQALRTASRSRYMQITSI